MTSGVALPASGGRRAAATVAAALGLLLAGTSLQGTGAYAGGQVNGADAGQVGAMSAVQNVKLGLNKSVVIDLPADAYDILVANPAVADAVTRTARRIYLFGKSVGETN
jgi:pilus assembly protein CpaC